MIEIILRIQAYVGLKDGEVLRVRMERKIHMPAAPSIGMRIRLVSDAFRTLNVILAKEYTLIEWDNIKQEYVVYLTSMDSCLSPELDPSELKLFGFEDAA